MELCKKEWIVEEEHLNKIKGIIEKQLTDSEKRRKEAIDEGVEISREFWKGDVTTIEHMYDTKAIVDINQNIQLVKREKQRAEIISNNIRKLKLLNEKLYFGRIDFKDYEYGDTEPIYIGASTLSENYDILIYDWRSPVSGMFYEYEIGKAEYKCPAGIIEGEISLKRQYNIIDGKIKYMFNTDLKIDDDILQMSLSNNCDEHMRTIIKSIQKEQNRVIRNKNENVLIVQGPAGSGKTSIALHRAAYVLYKYKDRGLKSDNIIIFSPNAIFNDYISQVLPELGEDKICQTTFMEYAIDSFPESLKLEDGYEQMEDILSGVKDEAYKLKRDNIKFKGTLEFHKIIQRYIEMLEEKYIKFEDIKFREWVIMTGEEVEGLYNKTYRKWPIKSRYEEMLNDIEHRLEQSDVTKLRYAQLEKDYHEESQYCYESIEDLDRVLNREIVSFRSSNKSLLSINELDIYKEIISNRELFNQISEEIDLPENINDILINTTENLNNNRVSFEDITPLLYIKHALGDMRSMSDIKYVIIDEAQDYSPFQYKVFKELFPKAGFTILGDINQSINPYVNTLDYNIIADIFINRGSTIIELEKSYRSTREISDFTRKIINNNTIVNVARTGDAPKVIEVKNHEDRINKIKEEIESMIEAGLGSIAIICKTSAVAYEAYKELSSISHRDINLIKKEDEEFKGGINIVPSYISKGLEFDGVIIFDGDEDVYSEEEERLLFYTICTRALHRLSIYYNKCLTRFIVG